MKNNFLKITVFFMIVAATFNYYYSIATIPAKTQLNNLNVNMCSLFRQQGSQTATWKFQNHNKLASFMILKGWTPHDTSALKKIAPFYLKTNF